MVKVCYSLTPFFSICMNDTNLFKTGYIDPDPDGGLQDDLASRSYRGLLDSDEYYDDED